MTTNRTMKPKRMAICRGVLDLDETLCADMMVRCTPWRSAGFGVVLAGNFGQQKVDIRVVIDMLADNRVL